MNNLENVEQASQNFYERTTPIQVINFKFSEIIKELLYHKKRSEATEEIVKKIKKENYIKSIRDDDKDEIWIYKEGIYLPNGKSYIEEMCREILGSLYSGHLKNDVISKIMTDTYIEQEIFFNNQNEHKNIIPVKNGLLNIETKELLNFAPNIYFFNKLPINYKQNQDCPFIKEFFIQILENEKDLLTMQELFGFSLLKEYRYEKAFMFLGNGRNGKSKAIELLKTFLGHENCANLSLKTIESDHFSICELQNKLVNISGDIGKTALNDTSIFKSLTGRDMIHASRKFKTMIKFVNHAKMIFSANELPRTSDMTEAFFQRWEILNFPYTFYNEIDYEVHKNDDKAKLRNPNIIQEILCDEELTGLLNWALKGLARLKIKKYFTCTKTSEEIKTMWIRKSDSATSFVNEMIFEDFEGFVSFGMIKMIYKNYCFVNNLKPLSDKLLRKMILDNTVANETRNYLEGIQTRGFEGISLSSQKKEKQNLLL